MILYLNPKARLVKYEGRITAGGRHLSKHPVKL